MHIGALKSLLKDATYLAFIFDFWKEYKKKKFTWIFRYTYIFFSICAGVNNKKKAKMYFRT